MNKNIFPEIQGDFLDNLGLSIDAILDSKLNPGLDGIIELTYGYKNLGEGKRFNTTLFQKYCSVSYEQGKLITGDNEEITPDELIALFLEKSQGDIERLNSIFNSLLENNDIGDGIKKQSVLAAIQSIMMQIEYAQNSVYFEVEKIGLGNMLTLADRNHIREKNRDYEQKLYGGKISDNKFESELIVEYFDVKISEYDAKTFEQKRKRVDAKQAARVLDSGEMMRLQGYIEKIRNYLREKDYDTIKKQITPPNKNSTEKLMDSLSLVTISVEEAIVLFNGVFEFLGLPQRARLGKPGEVGSIYDSPTEMVIPDSEEFKTLAVKRILTLVSHEILCHYINQKNHEENNGKLRYEGNVEKEEGLAILSEKGVLGSKLSGSDLITAPFSRILAGEILEPKEFEDFLDLYSDITERKASPEALRDRHKRNQEDNDISVQHKDVAYIRGLIASVGYLQNGGDIENLFSGKAGLEAIMNGDFAFDSETMMFPILLTDIFVFFLLSSKGGNMKFSHSNFVKYIESKYGEVIKKESFQKLEKVLSGQRMIELFTIFSPLFIAVANAGIDEGVSKNIERVRAVLDKKI